MVKIKGLFGKKLDGALLHTKEDLELFRHFRVLRVLGAGSFATVYQVQRKSDNRLYALKHINIRAIEPGERTDLVNEIRLLASLDHPNLLKYYEAFVDHHQLFIVTELVSHGDLGSLIEKRAEYEDWLPERQVWAYFLQLAVGLQYLHKSHVLHRDLKPQNVLVAEGGLLKIADLGISQILDHVFTHVLSGTPQYIAPEMWRRQPYSYSADIWALGCILHEMCSLKPLFLAPTDKEIRAKVLSGLLDSIPSRYSLDLWDVIRVMLSADPAERPTIDEILALPAVRERMHLLPEQDRPFLDPSHRSHASIMDLIRISTRFDRWDQLNDLLPPSKYPDGPGVVETLRMHRPSSCPDLTRLDGGDGGGEEGPAGASPPPALQGLGRGGAKPGLPPAAPLLQPARAHLQHNSSCPRLDGWDLDEALRRRSIAVGQLLYHRQKEAEGSLHGGGTAADALRAAGAQGPPGASPSGSPAAAPRWADGSQAAGAGAGAGASLSLKRTKSSGGLVPAARAGGVVGAREVLPWVTAAGASPRAFDTRPLEFGGGSTPRAVRYLSSDGTVVKAGGGAGAGGPAMHAPRTGAGALALHAATMVDSIGCGMHKEVEGLQQHQLYPTPHRASAESSGSSGSPKGVLASAGGSALGAHRGSGEGAARGLPPPAAPAAVPAGAGGAAKKERKPGKVRFMSRLKQRLWGDDHSDGMHQPIW